MKNGKELKVKTLKNFNVKYGTVDNKNLKSLYLNISSWIKPLIDDELNYSRIIKNLNKLIRQSTYNFLSTNLNSSFFKDHFIVDFDLRKSGIKYGKTSYLSCEITFYLKNETQINSPKIKQEITTIIDYIINNSFHDNNHFSFNKKKSNN